MTQQRLQIYLGELEIQSKFALKAYSEFDNVADSGKTNEIFYHLHHFVAHSASIERMLRDHNRMALIETAVTLSDLDFEPYRRLRNHLEHFDERLDRWIDEYERQPFYDMNTVTGTIGYPNRAFLRALDGRSFLFFGQSYDLNNLASLIRITLDRVETATRK